MFGVIYCDITKRNDELTVCKACGGVSPLIARGSSKPVFGGTITKFYRCEDCGATTTITTSENSCGRTNEANEEKADESKCRANFLKEKDFEGMSEADAILILVNEYSWPYSEAVDFVRFHLFKD